MTSATLPTPLVDAEQLMAARAAGAAPLIIDCSFDLADSGAGERAFAQGHLPGAVYAHLDCALAGAKTGRNGRHPLPARADFATTLARLGVTPARAVVVYDAQGGMYAARAWWMLRWVGHRAVSVLDGGLGAWTAAGGELEAGDVAPVAAATAYPAGDSLVATVDADTLLKSLGRVTLLDARAGERYRGEVEPLDARAGHIPGARSRFFKDNLDAQGRFRPAAELRAAFAAFGAAPAQVVHQCGSGVTACHNLLAMEVAGLAGSALYPGSWSEWSCDPARPVAVG
jgi:thiosulfate/3-mercaptopyruvate sulfurtransferase